MTRIARPWVAVIGALLLLLTAAAVVLAQDEFLDGKLRVGQSVTVKSDETVEGDLYLFAGAIDMNGTVTGDLVAFGGNTTVAGTVEGDVLALGGNVTISGDVTGDVRGSGGLVSIEGTVGEDVLSTGGRVVIAGSATVGGDLIVAGGQVTMDGTVDGSVQGWAGAYSSSGTVGGTESVAVQPEDAWDIFGGNRVLNSLRHFATVVILGALAIWLTPRIIRSAEEALRQRALVSGGSGLLAFLSYVAFIVAAFILMIVLAIILVVLRLGELAGLMVIGLMLLVGVVTFLFGIAAIYLADAVVGLALTRLVARDELASRWQELGLLIVGTAIVVLLTSIPVIGGWLQLLAVIFGLGALAMIVFRRMPVIGARSDAPQISTPSMSG